MWGFCCFARCYWNKLLLDMLTSTIYASFWHLLLSLGRCSFCLILRSGLLFLVLYICLDIDCVVVMRQCVASAMLLRTTHAVA